MATRAPEPKFAPADLVKYNNAGEYIVLAVSDELGFNRYHLLNIENGTQEVAATHELTKIKADIFEADEQLMQDILVEPETQENKKSRFRSLQPNELDELARKRTEPATDKQTTWAIRIFKGN
jgi:hypothetical protein